MPARTMSLIILMVFIFAIVSGCNSASISPDAYVNPITSSALSATPSPAPSIEASRESATEEPEPTETPGVWIIDDNLQAPVDDAKYLNAMYMEPTIELTADSEEIAQAKKKNITVGDWVYYFDTEHPM